MRKMDKKICIIGLIVALSTTSTFSVFAQESKNLNEQEQSEYYEGRYSISLDGLNIVEEKNTKNIKIELDDDVSFLEKKKVKESKQKIEFLLNRYDEELDEILIEASEDIKAGEKVSISYVECPLEVNDEGELVRIANANNNDNSDFIAKASAATKSKKGAEEPRYYFSLWTKVSRNDQKDSYGRYKYTCKTYGLWDENSVLSGEKYPADGYDYMMQSVPETFTRNSTSFFLWYNTGKEAVSGEHYWLCDGGSNYVKYGIVDDPVGLAQMEEGRIKTEYYAKSGTDRIINSYYVHTWKSMSVDVSVSASSEEEVTLDIDPGIEDKSWTLYAYVSFDF